MCSAEWSVFMTNPINLTAEQLQKAIARELTQSISVSPDQASDDHYYRVCATIVRQLIEDKRRSFAAAATAKGEKQVHYLSMEFLMGKSLKNSLYNFGMKDVFEQALESFGVKLENLYEFEPDPGLGNGGLGRLAACYLDALASTERLGCGYSILYEYGIFKQKISDGWQSELPDYWLPGGDIWLEAAPEQAVEVRFGGYVSERWDGERLMTQHHGYSTVIAVPYDLYVTGYDSSAASQLRLWRAKSPGIDMELFNKGDYTGAFGKNSYGEVISKVLYPNDNNEEGKLLRLRQQYFLACASVTDIFQKHMSNYGTIENFAKKNAIHINDTHPTLAIPELMRILLDECGYDWDTSWDVVKETFAYTNHTVMVEALEQWSENQMRNLLPRIYSIICEINRRFCITLSEQYHLSNETVTQMSIIAYGKVRMANLCVVGSHSVNGVSTLHSQIIKDDLFANFANITPEKFKNVTNGIASRRWLMQSNPLLTDYIKEHIGDGFLHDFSKLKDLTKYLDNTEALKTLGEIKYKNKEIFANYLKQARGISVDPSSLFDVQVKRLHEYKRQHLNALHIVQEYMYLLENPDADFQPKTYFFGAKAAPGYYLAKQIIKFICDLAKLIESNPITRKKLKIVFLEEYNVTLSERLMPASEISEQISLAGTEASGTGNMKLMLNGAITLGTMDGANVEIAEAVGMDNIIIFGMRTPEVERLKVNGYHPTKFINNCITMKKVLDFLHANRNIPSFEELHRYMITADSYMVAADFASYCTAQRTASSTYANENLLWQRMSLKNISQSGIFCADRAINDYAETIWYLDKHR